MDISDPQSAFLRVALSLTEHQPITLKGPVAIPNGGNENEPPRP